MLGDLVYEGRGKVIGIRVLPNGKIENTMMMQGMVLGEELSATWTAEIEARPDGTLYLEFRGFSSTKSGEMGRYKGNGNGTIGPNGSRITRGAVCYSFPPGKYAYLNSISVVYELELDKEGNFQSKGWEWK